MSETFDSRHDADAVRRVLGGETKAFDPLVERYFGAVRAVAYARLRDPEAAEDLAQEVFLRAFVQLATLRDPQALPAWLTGIARNLSLRWLRDGMRRSRVLPMVPIEENHMEIGDARQQSVRDRMAADQEHRRLHEEIMRLPEDQREVVLMHFGEDLNQAEIARILGVDRSTICRQLQRALGSLRQKLEQDLRVAAAPGRSRQAAARRATAIVATAAVLSGGAKSALAAAVADTAALAYGTGAITAAGAVKAAATIKVAVAAAITIGVVTTAVYFARPDKTVSANEPPPERITTVQRIGSRAGIPRTEPTRPVASQSVHTTRPAANGRIISVSSTTTGPQATYPPYDPGWWVIGIVRDALTSQPIADALIQIYVREPGLYTPDQVCTSTMTDASGEFRLSVPAGFSYVRCLATKTGYVMRITPRESPGIVRTDGSREQRFDIDMVPGAVIAGHVRNSSGDLLAGAAVSCRPATTMLPLPAAITDASGRYELTTPFNVPAFLQASARGYSASIVDNLAVAEKPLTQDFVLQPDTRIRGVVLGPDGQPAPQAQVTAMIQTFGPGASVATMFATPLTGPDGTFEITGVPERRVTIQATKAGAASSAELQVPALKPGEKRDDVELRLRAPHFIAGRVVDTSGTAVAEASISVSSTSRQNEGYVHTKPDGTFRVGELGGTVFSVLAHKDGVSTWTTNVAADRDDLVLVLPLANRIVTLVGSVVEAKTVTPLADFDVKLDSAAPIEKDPDHIGVFRVRLRPARHEITITAPGGLSYGPKDFMVEPTAPEAVVVYELTRAGSVTGKVIDAESGKPVAGTQVAIWKQAEWQASLRVNAFDGTVSPRAKVATGPDGTFRAEGLPAATYVCHYEPPKPYGAKTASLAIADGEQKDLGEVPVIPEIALRGRLVRAPGDRPIPSERVEIHLGYQEKLDTQTDSEGRFTFTLGRAGSFDISAPGLNRQFTVYIAPDHRDEITLRVGSATLIGRLTYQGAPFGAGVAVTARGPGGDHASTQSGPDGKFRLENLDPGTHQLGVSVQLPDARIASPRWEFTIAEGQTLEREFALTAPQLVGRVEDPDGNPVGGVSIEGPDLPKVTSNPDGTWIMKYPKPGPQLLVATKEGFGRTEQPVQVPEDGDSPPIVIRLKPLVETGSIVANVSTGTDAEWSVYMQAKRPDGMAYSQSLKFVGGGTITLQGLPPGSYDVSVAGQLLTPFVQRGVEVRAGETITLNAALRPAGSLSWQVSDAQGRPFAGARLRLQPRTGGEPAEHTTDALGMHMFTVLPGEYDAIAEAPGLTPVTRQVTIVAGRSNGLVTQLR